jgi:hypothetical protein
VEWQEGGARREADEDQRGEQDKLMRSAAGTEVVRFTGALPPV